MRFAISNMNSFKEIINHINIFYVSGNKGIKTIFNMDSITEKSRLDTGVCLKNMETFFQIANLAFDFGIIKDIQTEDVIKLEENLLLSKDLANCEKYQVDRSPGRTGGTNSLSQSVF